MRALVTFALENEFEPWRKSRRFQRVSVFARDRIYAARVGSVDVQVVLTGAGRFAAQRVMSEPFQARPGVCIASGLAGALKPNYFVGQVLAARGVTDLKGTRFILSDPELIRDADQVGATRVDRFVTSDHVVSTAFEKRSLAASGDAVDMESIYVLEAAAHQRIPAVAIRAISDDASSDLPLDFDRVFNERGAVSLPRVIGQAVTHPHRIKGLLRLARQSERAAAALASFLDRYLENITEGPFENAKADAIAV
jgi:adenosylhomocysteine nucleosidase